MKKISLCFFIFCLFISVSVVEAKDMEVLGREELISKYGLEESEFLDDFVEEYKPTSDYADVVYIKQVYNNYLTRRYSEKNDYTYLLDLQNNMAGTSLEPDNIKKILWFWNPGSDVEARIFDIENKILYYKDSNFLYNITSADSRTLRQDEVSRILEDLSKLGVLSWDEYYASSVDNSTGYLFWKIVIENKDGTQFVSEGSGSTADNLPATYSQVQDLLQIE